MALKQGGVGADILVGTNFADLILGDAGNDVLKGFGGNDVLNGGTGADGMAGGDGNDVYYVDNAGDDVIEGEWAGTDAVYSSIDYTLTDHVERLYLTGGAHNGTGNALGNDIWGNNANNNLSGLGGDDWLWGQDGDDLLVGGTGRDSLIGGNGSDTLDGGDGHDFLSGGAGADIMFGFQGDDDFEVDDAGDEVHGGIGHDMVYQMVVAYTLPSDVEDLMLIDSTGLDGTGNASNNEIWGNENSNGLAGLGGNDTIDGYLGNDLIDGGDGADILRGGDGDDTMLGGSSVDVLTGGMGRDFLSGGTGLDFFIWNQANETGVTEGTADAITDFNIAEGDRINLAAIDADVYAPGNQAFTFIGQAGFSGMAGEINYYHSGGNTYIQMQTGTTIDVEAVIRLDGIHNPEAGWFIL
jgi:Ca2+-binding RTX toxin-like protein